MTKNLSAEDMLAQARAFVKKKWPYIMSTIYGMIPIPEPKFPTLFITKGMVLAYNPKYVQGLSIPQVAAALVHEASHVLRGYFDRVIHIKHKELYNIAADMPINDDLKAAGWDTHPDWVYPETHGFPKGKTAEQYYEMLCNKNQSDKNQPGKSQGLGSGQCGAPSKQAEEDIDGQKDEQGNALGRSQADRNQILRRTFQDIENFVAKKGRGSLPGWLQEMSFVEPKQSRIPWRERLQSVVRDMTGPILSGGDDYSLKRPSKRSYTRGIVRPGLIDQHLVPLFIVDTSGSMDVKDMTAGINESIAVLNQLGIDEGYLCQVDAAVTEEPRLVNLQDLSEEIHFKGRGGTDFRPGFRTAMKMSPRPDMIFYWTDGEGPAPKTPSPIPTIWGVIPPKKYLTRRPAPWGLLVTITEDEDYPDDDVVNYDSDDDDDDEDTDMDEYSSVDEE